MMMLSGGGVVGFVIVAIALVVPFWYILPRAGLPQWLAVLTVLPFVAIILLWVMAFRRWPGDTDRMGV